MKQAVWRGMPYFDVFWRKRHLTRREMHAAFTSSYTYIFWALQISLMVLLDLHGFAERVSITALITYTTSLTAITVLLYLAATLIGLWLSKRYDRFFIFYPLVGFVSVTTATILVELGMSSYFGGGMSLQFAAQKLPVNLLLTLLLETIFFTFVMPLTQRPDAFVSPQAMPISRQCETLNIGGKTFVCADLLAVSSQDHYVNVRTKTGDTLLRARLSDIVGQLGCQSGTQPHRSHWVSRNAAVRMIVKDGHKVLELTDGSYIPVARGRVSAVQAWLAE